MHPGAREANEYWGGEMGGYGLSLPAGGGTGGGGGGEEGSSDENISNLNTKWCVLVHLRYLIHDQTMAMFWCLLFQNLDIDINNFIPEMYEHINSSNRLLITVYI